jgi:hemerythrin-like domain-containing protein
MAHLLDTIHDEHLSMSRLLDLLEQQIDAFESGLPADYQLMNEIIEYFLTFPDLFHHPTENLVLARLRQRAPDLASTVEDLDGQHADISEELRRFARVLANLQLEVVMPRDSFVKRARAFIERERKHMSAEESVFFPAARAGLTEEDWDELAAKTQVPRDPLAEKAKIRFALIRDAI